MSKSAANTHCITSHLYIPVARHDWIEHALTAVGYTVKLAVHTWQPGRAAVLPLVIVPLCHVGSN